MRREETYRQRRPNGFPWLAAAAVLAVLTLLIQVFPSLGASFVYALDARHRSRAVWILLNAGIVLVLLGARFGKEWLADVRTSVGRRKSHLRRQKVDQPFDTSDYKARSQRDAEWSERARKRMPFT